MKKLITRFADECLSLFGVVLIAIAFFGVTLLGCYLIDLFASSSKLAITVEQEYAIQDIKGDLVREAFRDCVQRNSFDNCYTKYKGN